MKKNHSPTLIGIIGIAGGLMILFVFPISKIEPAVPTIKVPGAYPYEEAVRIPLPESAALPSPAPFPYRESAPSIAATQDRDSRPTNTRRPLTAKAAREAALKYNGVPDFCGFLAALPADVSVFDPKLGRPRAVVKGGRVVRENAAWLRNRKQENLKRSDRAVVSVEELGARDSGI
jgi:hypothetical protein